LVNGTVRDQVAHGGSYRIVSDRDANVVEAVELRDLGVNRIDRDHSARTGVRDHAGVRPKVK
jgi:hypothetical protein